MGRSSVLVTVRWRLSCLHTALWVGCAEGRRALSAATAGPARTSDAVTPCPAAAAAPGSDLRLHTPVGEEAAAGDIAARTYRQHAA